MQLRGRHSEGLTSPGTRNGRKSWTVPTGVLPPSGSFCANQPHTQGWRCENTMNDEINVYGSPLMDDIQFLDAVSGSWITRGAAVADQVTLRETSLDRPDGTFELSREIHIQNPSLETLGAALRVWR